MEDRHRTFYLDLLRRHCGRHRVHILGYCLMVNHVHLVVVPEEPHSLARALGRTHNDYARWLQASLGLTGHLWQNRYWSCPMDEAHCWEALRYIELNPVRAGLAETAWEYRWSSAAAHVRGRDSRELLDLSAWAGRFTAAFWRESLEKGFENAALAGRLREATRFGRPLGSDEFAALLERKLGRRLIPLKRGPRPKPAASPLQLSFEVM